MLRFSIYISALLFIAYGAIFIVGIIGNGFLIILISRTPHFQTTTNVFIANLAVADLIVSLFCVPFTFVINLLAEWPFGETACKLIAYLEAVSVNASVNSLVAISLERCLKISLTFGFIVNRRKLILWITIIWLIPTISMIPWLIVFAVKPIQPGSKLMICTDFWHSQTMADVYFIIVNLISAYLLPLSIISICYKIIFQKIKSRQIPGELFQNQKKQLRFRSKMKTLKLLSTVIITFALSWLPIYVLFITAKFLDYPKTKEQTNIFHVLFPIAQWCGASNSCINPIIYTCFSQKFRAEFNKYIRSLKVSKQNCKQKSSIAFITTEQCVLVSTCTKE